MNSPTKNTFASTLKLEKEEPCLNHLSDRILNKDLIVWLDGARHANTGILPSFLWDAPMQPRGMPIPPREY